jgi:hypothetical protein
MEKSSRKLIQKQSLLKINSKDEERENEKKQSSQSVKITIFVGDDTGLLKKVNLAMDFEEDIISMPAPVRKRKEPHGEEDGKTAGPKEEAVIR